MDTRESGRIGGRQRAAKLSAQARSEIARQAAYARWAKVSPEQRSELLRKAVQVRWEGARSSRSTSLTSENPQKSAQVSDQTDPSGGVARRSLMRLNEIKSSAQQLLLERKLLTGGDWQRKFVLTSGFSRLTAEFLLESERFLDAHRVTKLDTH